MLQRLLLPALVLCVLTCFADASGAGPASAAYPIEAALMTNLDAAHVKVGDPVMAKLDRAWKYEQCKLPKGAVLVGHVMAALPHSRVSPSSQIALLFQADCGEAGRQALTWIALLAPDDETLAALHDGKPVVAQDLRSIGFFDATGFGSGPSSPGQPMDMAGSLPTGLTPGLQSIPGKSRTRPKGVKTGEVWQIPGLTLSVATGPAASSVLTSQKKDVRLARGSVLVLSADMAAPSAAVASKSTPGSSSDTPARDAASGSAILSKPTLPPPPEETEVCAAASCSIALPADIAPVAGAPTHTVGLQDLRYIPHLNNEVEALQYDAAMAFLGPQELLFTFNPHSLVSRNGEEEPSSHYHTVRAVVVDLATATVQRSVDWRVADKKQYLWPMGNGRVMAHVGQDLKIYGPGLREETTFHLPAPLAFLRHSPDWNHIAVGVIRELHSRALHDVIEEATSADPEEQVDILLLDGKLTRTGTASQSSRALPPILTDQGEIVLTHAGENRWRYEETTWAGATHSLIRVGSSCMPLMKSLGTNLLFATGCEVKGSYRWYRIWRADGSPVLKGVSTRDALDPTAVTDENGALFALVLPRSRSNLDAGVAFRGADLASESIRVYRARDGRSVFAAKMRVPIPTSEPAAFVPGDTGVAILDGEQIAIYPLPRE